MQTGQRDGVFLQNGSAWVRLLHHIMPLSKQQEIIWFCRFRAVRDGTYCDGYTRYHTYAYSGAKVRIFLFKMRGILESLQQMSMLELAFLFFVNKCCNTM